MDFIKKYWVWILVIVIILIVIIVLVNRKKETPQVIIQNPSVTSGQPTNNIAQIIAALGGLSSSIGTWGIFNGNNSSGSGVGGQ